MLLPTNPKLITTAFFDLNNTCLNMEGVTKEDITNYLNRIKQPYWLPLTLPESWSKFPFWPDAITGLWNLRKYKQITCVSLSNNPISLQIQQCRNAHTYFDFLVPLESYQVFKPKPICYKIACMLLKVDPANALMVTANKDFGDLEGASSIGMQTVWIDRENSDPNHPIKNLMDLVEALV